MQARIQPATRCTSMRRHPRAVERWSWRSVRVSSDRGGSSTDDCRFSLFLFLSADRSSSTFTLYVGRKSDNRGFYYVDISICSKFLDGDLWEKSWKPLGLKKLPWRKFLRGQLHVQQICQNLESLGLHRNFSRTILCKAEKLRNNGASRKILEAFLFLEAELEISISPTRQKCLPEGRNGNFG